MAIFFSKPTPTREPTSASTDWEGDGLIAAVLGYERRARSRRIEIFDGNIINDSSWPLLQDLFAAHLEGTKMRTKELCATSGLPQTTVLRYLDHLEKFDVVVRQNDPDDHRVTLVSISEGGAFWMHEYYTHVIAAERTMARNEEGLFSLEKYETSDRPPRN